MTLISEPLTLVKNITDSGAKLESKALEEFIADPTKAIPTSDVTKFVRACETVLKADPTTENVETLKTLQGLSKPQVSAALFNSGIEVSNLSSITANLNSNLSTVTSSLTSAAQSLAGGIPAIANTLKTIKSPTELSMADIKSLALGVFGGVGAAQAGGALGSLLSKVSGVSNILGGLVGGASVLSNLSSTINGLANKSPDAIVKGLFDSAAKSLSSAIAGLEKDITNLSPASFMSKVANVSKLFNSAVDKNIAQLASTLINPLKSVVDITKSAVESIAKNTESEVKTQRTKLKNLPAEIPHANSAAINEVKEILVGKLAAVNKLATDPKEMAKIKAQAVAIAKKTQDNTPNSSNTKVGRTLTVEQHRKELAAARNKEVENLAKKQTTEANKAREARIKRDMDDAKNKAREAVAKCKDLGRASARNEANSSRAGRKVTERGPHISNAERYSATQGIHIPASYFFPSKYATHNAMMINRMHPSVRAMFANFLRDYIQWAFTAGKNKTWNGFDCRVSSTYRSAAHQARLTASIKAGAGTSQHQYGLAMDVNVVYKGRRRADLIQRYLVPFAAKHKIGWLGHVSRRMAIKDPFHFSPNGSWSKYTPRVGSTAALRVGLGRKIWNTPGNPWSDANFNYMSKFLPAPGRLYDLRKPGDGDGLSDPAQVGDFDA